MNTEQTITIEGAGCTCTPRLVGKEEGAEVILVQANKRDGSGPLIANAMDLETGKRFDNPYVILHIAERKNSKSKGLSLKKKLYFYSLYKFNGESRENPYYKQILDRLESDNEEVDKVLDTTIILDDIWAGTAVSSEPFYELDSEGNRRKNIATGDDRITNEFDVITIGESTDLQRAIRSKMRSLHRSDAFVKMSYIDDEGNVSWEERDGNNNNPEPDAPINQTPPNNPNNGGNNGQRR